MAEKKKTCPCEFGDPCSKKCSCGNPELPGFCKRCCKYGSPEEQQSMADAIIAVENRNFKAPIGYVVDDKGDLIKGEWEHKNDGHGGMYWRFNGESSQDPDNE